MKITSYKKDLLRLLFKRSQMSNGMMYQVSNQPKRVSKKQLLCQLNSPNFLKEAESLGREFYFTVLPEQVRVSWQKLVQQNAIVLSFRFLHLIWLVNGKVSLKSLSKIYSKWQEIRSHPWFLSMRLIPSVVREPRVKMNLQEESKLSSLFKWMVVVMIKLVFLSWEPPILPGNWMMPSEEDFRRESTYICQTNNQELICSSSKSRELGTQ